MLVTYLSQVHSWSAGVGADEVRFVRRPVRHSGASEALVGVLAIGHTRRAKAEPLAGTRARASRRRTRRRASRHTEIILLTERPTHMCVLQSQSIDDHEGRHCTQTYVLQCLSCAAHPPPFDRSLTHTQNSSLLTHDCQHAYLCRHLRKHPESFVCRGGSMSQEGEVDTPPPALRPLPDVDEETPSPAPA